MAKKKKSVKKARKKIVAYKGRKPSGKDKSSKVKKIVRLAKAGKLKKKKKGWKFFGR